MTERLGAALERAAERVATMRKMYDAKYSARIEQIAHLLARALRAHGDVVEDKGWHRRECTLAYDWSHYQIESPCTCGPDRDALDRWGVLTKELSDG